MVLVLAKVAVGGRRGGRGSTVLVALTEGLAAVAAVLAAVAAAVLVAVAVADLVVS